MDRKAKAKYVNDCVPGEEVLRARVVSGQFTGKERPVPFGKDRGGSWVRSHLNRAIRGGQDCN